MWTIFDRVGFYQLCQRKRYSGRTPDGKCSWKHFVSYRLHITNIDPIRYSLLFERFLNPERVSMPDIDIDFCYERRQEVIDYVGRKYGKEKLLCRLSPGAAGGKGCHPRRRARHGSAVFLLGFDCKNDSERAET